ncbi:MAG: elongation factor G, partial [Candidatus Aureabacteria bacterium]|nr:elongation factor G [Candidatus Auribacterota bacterium]
ANTRQGSVDQGTSLSDTDEEEKSRKISIRTVPLSAVARGVSLFFLDTPGYADFWGEVEMALAVADSAVIVVDGTGGADAGTRRVWNAARQKGLPVSIFVTKLDKEHANFSACLDRLREAFGETLIPVSLPRGDSAVESLFEAFSADTPGEPYRAVAASWREKLIDAAAASDDVLIEKYLASGILEPAEIASGFRAAFIQGKAVPVFPGASTTLIGVREFLKSICDFFPSPRDRGPLQVGDQSLPPDKGAPLAAQVFKSVTDPFVGQLSYLRIWSGTLLPESEVYNSSKGKKEKIGHIYFIRGKDQITVPAAIPGFIVALAKLKVTSAGDTLCAPGQTVKFPPIRFPSPTAIYAVYPKNRGDEERISEAFHKFTEEDPTLIARRDPLTKEFILSGLGDVQIQVVMSRMRNNFHVDVDLREPRVAYKETLKGRGDTKYRHKKQTGGSGQFAEVWMHVQPYTPGAENAEGRGRRELIELPWGGKLLFSDEVVGGHIPGQLVQSVKKGFLSAAERGVLAGFPVVDVIGTVYDGKTHPVDSKDIAFQIAGRMGFKESCRAAKPVLLEPIMNVSIRVPMEQMGAITGDLNSRRGRILGMSPEAGYQVIKAQVPMAELLRYSTELRSMTGGAGEFSMEFDRYEEVPAMLAQKIVAAQKKEKEEEEE